MRRLLAPLTRPRRYSRAQFIMLGCTMVVMTFAAVAILQAPHGASYSAIGTSLDAVAVDTHVMAAPGAGHGSISAAPADATCATCGHEQEGAMVTCALILFAMAVLRLAPRSPVPTVTTMSRLRPPRPPRWATPRAHAPSLSSLCIMRT